jgi:hypothetical protein
MTPTDRVDLERALAPLFVRLKSGACEATAGGSYCSFTPGHPLEVPADTRRTMLEQLLSPQQVKLAFSIPGWTHGKGLFTSPDGKTTVAVGIGAEHLTFRCERTTRRINDAFEAITSAITAASDKSLRFARSDDFGWLTSEPSCVGSGLSQAAVRIELVEAVGAEKVMGVSETWGVVAMQGPTFGGSTSWQLAQYVVKRTLTDCGACLLSRAKENRSAHTHTNTLCA